jgi:hypothetical protein
MSSKKNYHALIPDKVYMGAAYDVESMVINEGIEVVVDLRGEATECAYPAARLISKTRRLPFIVVEEKEGLVRSRLGPCLLWD